MFIKVFLVLFGISLGASAGWWCGSKIGLMTGYFLSVFGASAGLYFSRQFCRNYLD